MFHQCFGVLGHAARTVLAVAERGGPEAPVELGMLGFVNEARLHAGLHVLLNDGCDVQVGHQLNDAMVMVVASANKGPEAPEYWDFRAVHLTPRVFSMSLKVLGENTAHPMRLSDRLAVASALVTTLMLVR